MNIHRILSRKRAWDKLLLLERLLGWRRWFSNAHRPSAIHKIVPISGTFAGHIISDTRWTISRCSAMCTHSWWFQNRQSCCAVSNATSELDILWWALRTTLLNSVALFLRSLQLMKVDFIKKVQSHFKSTIISKHCLPSYGHWTHEQPNRPNDNRPYSEACQIQQSFFFIICTDRKGSKEAAYCRLTVPIYLAWTDQITLCWGSSSNWSDCITVRIKTLSWSSITSPVHNLIIQNRNNSVVPKKN